MENYYRTSHIWWNLKSNDTDELTKQKQTHRLREMELIVVRGKDAGRDS